MEHIDEDRLESDLGYRFGYLAKFIGFGEEDIAAIHGAAGALGPLVPSLVDAVYDKLFSYDATKRHFVPRQHGYEGEVPESIDALTLIWLKRCQQGKCDSLYHFDSCVRV